jgi:hypothetical protein
VKNVSRAMLAMVLLAGCKIERDVCVSEPEEGDTYEVTITRKLEQALFEAPTCPIDDIKVGDKHTITARGKLPQGNRCLSFECPDNFPTASERTPDTTSQNTRYLTEICRSDHRKIKLTDSCEVGRWVALSKEVSSGTIYETAPNAQGNLPVTLIRLLTNGGGNLKCDQLPDGVLQGLPPGNNICADAWEVQLKLLDGR